MKAFTQYMFLFIVAITTSCAGNNKLVNKNQNTDHQKIVSTLQKVLDWQIAHFTYKEEGNLHDYGIDAWTNGVLFLGASEFAKIAGKEDDYTKWLLAIETTGKSRLTLRTMRSIVCIMQMSYALDSSISICTGSIRILK